MAGPVWCRRAVLILVIAPGLGRAAAPPPSASDIIEKLTPPKASELGGTSRGIRAAAPEPEAPPSIDLAIPFASGSATLEPAGDRIVATLGHALASPSLSGSHFKIEGHADTVGDASANLVLSQRRAATVVALLSSKYDVPAAMLQPVGVGSENLVVQTADQVDEPRNRVVRVINLGP
jgi:outer membrane protein OmpA-like peptidoglycan-associated protein